MKRMILNDWKRLVLVLLCSPLVQGAGAQEKVTLSQCYEWARANYPQVRQYRLIEQTEQYNLSNAAKGWLPQLAVNAKATYQSDVTKLPFDADKLSAIIPGIEIPTLSKDQYQVVAEVNQTIWDGGVIRSTRRLTEAQATADREQLNSDLYILNDRVNQLYFGCLLQDELIRQNRMAGGHAVYALEDRVERLCNLAFDASFATEADARLTLRYGVSLRRENTRSYKQMRDLLGAGYVTDIDRFLIDDDTYSNLLQNDLRHPGRTVREGDRFGYDYALTLRGAALRLQADYRSDRFRADLSVVLGSDAVSRRGYYEKELFPGGQSYGPSRVMRFTPYTLKAAAGWAFSPRRYIEIAAAAAARTPRAGDLFFQPLYNNRTVDNPVPERIYAAELNCRLTGPVVDFQAAFFAAMTLDGIETRTYYDDMASVYCDMAVTGVGRMSCGAEAAADIRLSYRWLLSLAASAGRYEYIRDPRVTVLSDVDNSAVDVQAVSRMGGCETGGAPQLTALAEIAWFGPKGWGCRASAGYAGRRYVEPMPLRRTDRIAGQGGITREFFDAFTRQERLPDAFTLDAALFKSFRFERSRLTASLMLRNLTGEADTVYGGYESLRVRRIRPGDDTLYAPHASRCTYAWPRSFYLTISYRF